MDRAGPAESLQRCRQHCLRFDLPLHGRHPAPEGSRPFGEIDAFQQQLELLVGSVISFEPDVLRPVALHVGREVTIVCEGVGVNSGGAARSGSCTERSPAQTKTFTIESNAVRYSPPRKFPDSNFSSSLGHLGSKSTHEAL
ncbi:hypothetical protein ATN38_00325 [Rhodococcus sp. FH8]|nr:hypothetical protein [Rhodococcus sp. FH8]